MSKGSVAYRGVVPPEALSLVKRMRDFDGMMTERHEPL
jgi:hypothetical protein